MRRRDGERRNAAVAMKREGGGNREKERGSVTRRGSAREKEGGLGRREKRKIAEGENVRGKEKERRQRWLPGSERRRGNSRKIVADLLVQMKDAVGAGQTVVSLQEGTDLIVGRITAVVVTIAVTAPRTAVHRHQKRDGGQTVERTGRK